MVTFINMTIQKKPQYQDGKIQNTQKNTMDKKITTGNKIRVRRI